MIALATVAFCLAMAGLLFGLAWPALVDARSHLAIEPEESEPAEWPGLSPAEMILELEPALALPGNLVYVEAFEPEILPAIGWLHVSAIRIQPIWQSATLAVAARTEEDWALECRCAGSLPGARLPTLDSLIAARRAYIARLEASNFKPVR